MFENISYKTKIKYLWISAIILLLLCYKFSFLLTYKAFQEYQSNNRINELKTTSSFTINSLQSKNEFLDKIIGKYILDTLDNSKSPLHVIGDYCNKMKLTVKEFKPGKPYLLDSVKIQSQIITLEGGYIECLQLIYQLEHKIKIGRVSSAHFISYSDQNSAKLNLSCTLFLQNIVSNNNE